MLIFEQHILGRISLYLFSFRTLNLSIRCLSLGGARNGRARRHVNRSVNYNTPAAENRECQQFHWVSD